MSYHFFFFHNPTLDGGIVVNVYDPIILASDPASHHQQTQDLTNLVPGVKSAPQRRNSPRPIRVRDYIERANENRVLLHGT